MKTSRPDDEGGAQLRLASLGDDGWELRSAEAAHHANPTTFWIPPEDERRNLLRGQAVKLIFDQEGVEDDGSRSVQGERMYVIVSHKVGDLYMGMLTSKPMLLEPADSVYLCAAAEVLFGPEHVIDIEQPPDDFVQIMFSEPPVRTWPYRTISG